MIYAVTKDMQPVVGQLVRNESRWFESGVTHQKLDVEFVGSILAEIEIDLKKCDAVYSRLRLRGEREQQAQDSRNGYSVTDEVSLKGLKVTHTSRRPIGG